MQYKHVKFHVRVQLSRQMQIAHLILVFKCQVRA